MGDGLAFLAGRLKMEAFLDLGGSFCSLCSITTSLSCAASLLMTATKESKSRAASSSRTYMRQSTCHGWIWQALIQKRGNKQSQSRQSDERTERGMLVTYLSRKGVQP